jgi:hypothetical protein
MDNNKLTFEQRFIDAIKTLVGKEPPLALVKSWLAENEDDRNDDLQDWVGNNGGPWWMQNIVILDAAHVLAEAPIEGGQDKIDYNHPRSRLDILNSAIRERDAVQKEYQNSVAEWKTQFDLVNQRAVKAESDLKQIVDLEMLKKSNLEEFKYWHNQFLSSGMAAVGVCTSSIFAFEHWRLIIENPIYVAPVLTIWGASYYFAKANKVKESAITMVVSYVLMSTKWFGI